MIGWVYETVICSIIQKRFIYRGFLNGPYCPIYGFGAVLNILVLGKVHNPFLLFFDAALLTGILEYLTSWGMEKLFHARWWDYSDQKFNINGRVFLPGAVVFGLLSLAQLKWLQPAISALTSAIPGGVRSAVSLALFTVILTDAVYTITKLSEFDEILRDAAGKLDGAIQSVRTLYENASNNYQETFIKINAQIRRTLASFPKLKSMRYNEKLKKLRELIRIEKNKGGRL
jgi:uncharacterized membrane protein